MTKIAANIQRNSQMGKSLTLSEYCCQVPANRIGFVDNGGPFNLVPWGCKKGRKWVSCTLVVSLSAYMADIQLRLIIRRQQQY